RAATADGRHEELVDAALRGLLRTVHEHRDDLRRRFGDQAPWWLPGAVEDRIFERLLDGARALVRDMVADPQHHLRRELDAALRRLAEELATSPALAARLEGLKRELLEQPQLRDWAGTIWDQVKGELRAAAADPDSRLRSRVASAAQEVGARLDADPDLRATVENGI